MHTIRQTGGLAGFPKRDESVHDAFGVGHSSTSISAALGNTIVYIHVCITFKEQNTMLNIGEVTRLKKKRV